MSSTCSCNLHADASAHLEWMKPELRISIGRCVPELLPVFTCEARALHVVVITNTCSP